MSVTPRLKYFSMFSGIGGFEIGIQQAFEGWEREGGERSRGVQYIPSGRDMANIQEQPRDRPVCVGYSEIDKYAIKVYERQFNGHKNYGDATKINAKELPDFDLLVGGFPCQAFSVAGKRKGFDDTRGTLFFDIARVLAEKRPRHLVLENVKGLLSHDGGKTFQTILGVLSDLGYRVEWQVLNSKDFGVPQNRERIYFVGHLGNECRRKVFPITGNGRQDSGQGKPVFSTVRATYPGNWNGDYIDTDTIYGQKEINQLNQPKHSNDRVYGIDGVSPTLNTMQGGNRQPFIAPVLTPDRVEKRQNGRRMKENGDPVFTVTAQDRHGLYDGARIRRLTPKECERLQGFPDSWTEFDQDGQPISDTQRYKMCGNAVTVNVVEAVMRGLAPCL